MGSNKVLCGFQVGFMWVLTVFLLDNMSILGDFSVALQGPIQVKTNSLAVTV